MIKKLLTIKLTVISLLNFLWFFINKPSYIIYLSKIEIIKYYPYLITLYYAIILIILWLFLQSILEYIIKKFFNTKNLTEKKVTMVAKLLTWCIEGLQKINIFNKTYAIILDFIGPEHVHKIIKLAKLVLTFPDKKNLYIIISFVLLPRLIIVLIFIYEIYLGKLHYYFYSLMLLIIPLILRAFTFIFNDISPRVLPTFMSYVNNITVTEHIPDLPDNIQLFQFTMKPEYSRINIDFFMEYFYYPLTQIVPVMEEFIAKQQKIRLIIVYIYYIIHLVGWSFVTYTVILYPI